MIALLKNHWGSRKSSCEFSYVLWVSVFYQLLSTQNFTHVTRERPLHNTYTRIVLYQYYYSTWSDYYILLHFHPSCKAFCKNCFWIHALHLLFMWYLKWAVLAMFHLLYSKEQHPHFWFLICAYTGVVHVLVCLIHFWVVLSYMAALGSQFMKNSAK